MPTSTEPRRDQRWKLWWLPLALLALSSAVDLHAAEEPPEAKVTVALELRLGERLFEPEKGVVELLPLPGGSDEGREAIKTAFAGVSLREVKLPAGSKWRMQGTIEGHWAPTVEFTVGSAGATELRRLFWWPAGVISAKLRVAKGEAMPTSVIIEGEVPLHRGSSKTAPRRISHRCPVAQDGSLSCVLPAARFDLRLRGTNYVPRYFWSLRIPRQERLSLGTLDLVRGASITGTVLVEEGILDPKSCIARLLPIAAAGNAGFSGYVLKQRLAQTARTAPVSARGFFQFEGVAAGSYLLQVEQPGYASARLQPLEVWPESESALDTPLILRRPLQVEFQIYPALDWLEQPWKVLVVRRVDSGPAYDKSSRVESWADETGLLKLPNQVAGRFDVTVIDSLGNRLYSDFDLFIDGPESAHQEIRLEFVDLEGELSYRDEPLAATLWFGGRSGGLRSKMVADEKGRFEGVLPRGGNWLVDVEAKDPEIDTSVKISVHPTRSRDAKVEIALPDSEIFGRVVDEEGQPVAGASVQFSSSEDSLFGRSGEDGGFEFLAPALGLGQLYAEDARLELTFTSDVVKFEVVEGQAGGPYELRLRATKLFTGRVLSDLGPIPGAVVSWTSAVSNLLHGSSARTDLEGWFSGQTDQRSQSLLLTVSAPGHALTAASVKVSAEPVSLWVAREGGTIQLTYPFSKEELLDQDLMLFFFQNGHWIAASVLTRWVLGQGLPVVVSDEDESHRVVPRMAAGQYRACFLPKAIRTAESLQRELASTANCASGYLAVGATLELAPNPPD